MSLTGFLIFGAIFLGIILVVCIVERSKFIAIIDHNALNKHKWLAWVYFVVLVLLGWTATRTATRYIYPTDTDIFSNADYHVLRHKGYEIGGKLYLAHGLSEEDEGFQRDALWDKRNGIILLDGDSLYLKESFEPFYAYSQISKTKAIYTLQNCYIDTCLDNGLVITRGENDTVYTLRIEHYKAGVSDKLFENDEKFKHDREFYISSIYTPDGIMRDTSDFTRKITMGYPLLEIIAQSPNLELTPELETMFANCYLVKRHIHLYKGVVDNKQENTDLCLMPSLSFFLFDDLRVNGKHYDINRTFSLDVSQGARFMSGIGRGRTDEYNLSAANDNGRRRLMFQMPHMKQLRDMNGRVFVTSSLKAVERDAREGGYLFNYFSEPDNFHHINANIRYSVGTARDSMLFEVFDLQSENPSKKQVVSSDSEFLLSSKDKTESGTAWIFDIRNLRESNQLQWSMIIRFVLIFLLLVGLRILIDSIACKSTSFSHTEFAVYVLLLCFCVVRMILNWRTTTFVPIEEISYPVFAKMRSNTYLITAIAACSVPIIMCVRSLWKKYREDFPYWQEDIKSHSFVSRLVNNNFTNRVKQTCRKIFLPVKKVYQKLQNIASSYPGIIAVVALFLALVACFFLSRLSLLNRLCNIPIPLLIYLILEIWIAAKKQETDSRLAIPRILNFVIIFGYLLVQDAGFTIIFAIYAIFQEFVIEKLFSRSSSKRVSKAVIAVLVCCAAATVAFFGLYIEGQWMIWLFKHIGWVSVVVSLVAVAGAAIYLIFGRLNKIERGIGVCCTALLALVFVLCILDATGLKQTVTPIANSKIHMRYRAEIQRLAKDQTIDDLIRENEFDSDDIVFIMRSAHNQWFINQYIEAGRNREHFFQLQPHSIQGCTYTTQTTDLVVTRYILAEHGEDVVRLLLCLFVVLLLIYIFEMEMSSLLNRKYMAGLTLLTFISLMVFLSATNRIVFVGQDFPLISLQSRVAVLFPVALMLLAMWRTQESRIDKEIDRDTPWEDGKGIVFTVIIACFFVGCMYGIDQKGQDQNAEKQFNVSRLITDISEKVDKINVRFHAFQSDENIKPTLNRLKISQVWERFIENENYSDIYQSYINDTVNSPFFSSLLRSFDGRNQHLTDAEQLLHLRRHGNTCSLAVNKKHYSIPAIKEEDERWTGNLLAARVDENYSLYGLYSDSRTDIDNSTDHQINILPPAVGSRENLWVSTFNSEWSDTGKPLILLSSFYAKSGQQYFTIENDSIEVFGDGRLDQPTTLVCPGDVFVLTERRNGKERPVLSRQLTHNGQNYLARNIWLNGHRQLFYPLGRESMWSYHFANLVSETLSRPELLSYRDTTLQLSIDYDLHKTIYSLIEKEEKEAARTRLKENTRRDLIELRTRDSLEQRDSIRHKDLYFSPSRNKLVCNKKGEMETVVNKINRFIRTNFRGREFPLNEALDSLLEQPFDFSTVVIDGDGKIRLLLDYSRRRDIDPNNIAHINRVISEIYTDGTSRDVRDIFGNKALQFIPMGPGSSLKPVVYTAATSQKRLDWESIDVLKIGWDDARHKETDQRAKSSDSGVKTYDFYGGIHYKADAHEGGPFFLEDEGELGLRHDSYLTRSDNLYHSIVVMLGLMSYENAEHSFKPYQSNEPNDRQFPVFTYKNAKNKVCFDPEVWFADGKINMNRDGGILGTGLYYNFHFIREVLKFNDIAHENLFGSGLMDTLFTNSSSTRAWSYSERGSQNIADRLLKPQLRTGFNQILLGANPLEITPLEMAVNAHRLASLNSARNVTTLIDNDSTHAYEPFKIDDSWTQTDYLHFIHRQVWGQMARVPLSLNWRGKWLKGTASGLQGKYTKRENENAVVYNKARQKYYVYCKTGTLNDTRNNNSKIDRIRHLMVIITDRRLESVNSLEELAQVKHYVMYMSYMGVKKGSEFSNANFGKYIEATINSAAFIKYMKGE